MFPVIEWNNNKVIMINQRELPLKEEFIEHSTHLEVANSIKNMVIRGAPAIGVAAAMGIALGVINSKKDLSLEGFNLICENLLTTRPTAVNLSWAVKRMRKVYYQYQSNLDRLQEEMVKEALKIDQEDVIINKKIGENGEKLLKTGQTILTYCNAGALATAGFGTALGVIRAAVNNNKEIEVIASETRPYLQGARLTVWELQQDQIPVKLITDNMAGYLMSKGKIDAIITGADRIAANGDTANKIGTFALAVLANYHQIPFYIAAPLSTIDIDCPNGAGIPIEERDKDEVLHFLNQRIARPQTNVYNPAFDITPYHLISALITEIKVLNKDYIQQINKLFYP